MRIEKEKQFSNGKLKSRFIPVLMFSESERYICSFTTAEEAGEFIGVPYNRVILSCRGIISLLKKHYKFRFLDNELDSNNHVALRQSWSGLANVDTIIEQNNKRDEENKNLSKMNHKKQDAYLDQIMPDDKVLDLNFN